MADPFTFGDNMQPIALPAQEQRTLDASIVTVVGWSDGLADVIIDAHTITKYFL